jgi:L-idonate 5-dehydrogenase
MTHVASVLSAAQKIDVIDRTLPTEIPEGYVRLRMATASLCGTDLHYYRHFQNAGFVLQRPVTLGHEGCGHVTDANGSGLAVGQLVALNPIIHCGTCEWCAGGQSNLCTAKRFPGSATTVPHIDGFFQEEFDFPAKCCVPVPEGTNPDHLTFAEPLACAMHSVTVSGAVAGSRVLVTGCGPMGLLALVAARAVGAEVEVSDVRAEAVALAVKVGAGKGYVAGRDEVPALSYDAVIEASGAPQAFNQALEAVRRQGRVSILSNIQPTATPINLHRIMLKEITVAGSFQFNKEFGQALDLILSGAFDFDQLIAARFGLHETGEALALMQSGGASGKILIKPAV